MEVVLQEPALARRREQDHGKTENPGKMGDVEEPQGVLAQLKVEMEEEATTEVPSCTLQV